jgi:cytochrome c oxidase subunit 2
LRARLLTFGVGLILFVAIDVTLAVRASGHLHEHFWNYPDADPSALRVEVTARQWSWTFRTAGPDARFGTPDDVVTLGELHVPIGRPVYVKLRSKDVVHSLYLPNFRTKIDAIPAARRGCGSRRRRRAAPRSAARSIAVSATTRCAAG